jgi:transposase-like protein
MRQLMPSFMVDTSTAQSLFSVSAGILLTSSATVTSLSMMAERGVGLSYTTILQWVQGYVPEFEKRGNRIAHPIGTSWRVDETYIKIRGRWASLYRAVDPQGRTIDLVLSKHRNIAAAKRFFRQTIAKHGIPERITLDGYPATHSAVPTFKKSGELRPQTKLWTSKYLNNMIEQDHRKSETARLSDARLQEVRQCGHHY